ncbi:MAG: DUF4416 domain-containing protein [Spirochaetae bacterium HGW-Spirochaetae-9]|nr:MAG: DUF4416 domain-containing protein [Spirochaetae bacterium HGW-Spirochaetae-9]
MGASKNFGQEILIIGVLSADLDIEEAILAALEAAFGPVASVSAREPFAWTDYYQAEMGAEIFRYYLEFRNFIDPSRLASIKAMTNALEMQFSSTGKRRANLDPGLLAPGRFVLATTKDRAHRIALSEGIYAELTLIYEKGEFHPLPWTYPDWASDPVRSMLASMRKRLFPPKA